MKINTFIAENKNKINNNDLIIIRNLYQPIISVNGTSLYQLLVDYLEVNNNSLSQFHFSEIKELLNLSEKEILIAKDKLEACSLLQTFYNESNKTIIFVMKKPMNSVVFKKSLLSKKLATLLSESYVERFYFYKNSPSTTKIDYKDITKNFQSVFENPEDLLKQQNTLELPMIKPRSVEEAILGLTSLAFIKYITDINASPSQIDMINVLSQYGFSSISINYLVNYSFVVNKMIVIRYINKIAKDFLKRGISNSNEIKLELNLAIKSKQSKSNNYNDSEVIQSKKPVVKSKRMDIWHKIGDF